jgi:LPS O-antigen subunit length determinant protein (WzzB/FepE family)
MPDRSTLVTRIAAIYYPNEKTSMEKARLSNLFTTLLEINLIEVLASLVENKDLIILVGIVFTLLAVGYAISIPTKYRATIGFLIPQKFFTKVWCDQER